MHGYHGIGFLKFFVILFYRMVDFVQSPGDFTLASDEIQIIVLSLIAASCAALGCLLVLRKMTMLANSISHTILLGIVVSFLLARFFTHSNIGLHIEQSTGILFLGAFLAGGLTSILTDVMTKYMKLQEDASIGLVFSGLFSLGIVLITLFTKNTHIGLDVVMGNADGLTVDDVSLAFVVASVCLLSVAVLHRLFKITIFDAGLSKLFGFKPGLSHFLMMLLTSFAVVGAFRVVGVLMVLAYMVIPPLIARLITCSYGKMIWISLTIAIVNVVVSVALSRHLLSVYHMPLSTTGISVCILLIAFFGLIVILSRKKGILLWLNKALSRKVNVLKS